MTLYYNNQYKEWARFARSLLVRVCRYLSGMDDIIIMHSTCTVPRALTVLYCTCSDLQFMVLPTFNLNDHFHIVNLLQ